MEYKDKIMNTIDDDYRYFCTKLIVIDIKRGIFLVSVVKYLSNYEDN